MVQLAIATQLVFFVEFHRNREVVWHMVEVVNIRLFQITFTSIIQMASTAFIVGKEYVRILTLVAAAFIRQMEGTLFNHYEKATT